METTIYSTIAKKAGWVFNPPIAIPEEEAIRYFVEGMEYAAKSQRQAIDDAFDKNLNAVFDECRQIYLQLEESRCPLNNMYVRPISIYIYKAIISVDADFFVLDEMLKYYSQNNILLKSFHNKNKNLNLQISFMPIDSSIDPNFETLISDGYMFQYAKEKKQEKVGSA